MNPRGRHPADHRRLIGRGYGACWHWIPCRWHACRRGALGRRWGDDRRPGFREASSPSDRTGGCPGWQRTDGDRQRTCEQRHHRSYGYPGRTRQAQGPSRGKLQRLLQEGQRIASIPGPSRLLALTPPWQDNVHQVLYSALLDPWPATQFALLGLPLQGQSEIAGLGGRLASQINELERITQSLGNYDIKESWQP